MTLNVIIGNGSWRPVSGTAPSITSPASLPTGSVNSAYTSTTFTATGTAPVTWSITSGTLPTGMSFSLGGSLYGTPTVSSNSSITFTATNSFGSNNSSLNLTVVGFDGPTPLTAPIISVWRYA